MHAETKLSKFDQKIKDIEIMVNLLESKLNSLPSDITSKYPQSDFIPLSGIKPELTVFNPAQEGVQESRPDNIIEPEKIEEREEIKPEPVEDTPRIKLQKFLEENKSDELDSLHKMIKYGIPEQGILQKAKLINFNMDLVKVKYFFKIRHFSNFTSNQIVITKLFLKLMKPICLVLFIYAVLYGQFVLFSLTKIRNNKNTNLAPIFDVKGNMNMSLITNTQNAIIENKEEMNEFSYNNEKEINKQGESNNVLFGVEFVKEPIDVPFLSNLFTDEFHKLIQPDMVSNFTQQIKENAKNILNNVSKQIETYPSQIKIENYSPNTNSNSTNYKESIPENKNIIKEIEFDLPGKYNKNNITTHNSSKIEIQNDSLNTNSNSTHYKDLIPEYKNIIKEIEFHLPGNYKKIKLNQKPNQTNFDTLHNMKNLTHLNEDNFDITGPTISQSITNSSLENIDNNLRSYKLSNNNATSKINKSNYLSNKNQSKTIQSPWILGDE